MLENTLTLSLPNGGTPVNMTITRIDVFQNRSVYHEPTHSTTVRRTVGFYRTLPKRSGDFLGVSKSAAKTTMDLSVLDAKGATITAPAIGEISFSVPIGATEAAIDSLLDRLDALISNRTVIKRTILGPEI